MVAIPGAGAIRSLVVSLRLDDGGFAAGMAAADVETSALKGNAAGVGNSLYAMRAQMAVLGFTSAVVIGGMVREWAEFEQQAAIAAAAQETVNEAVAGMEIPDFAADFRQRTREFQREVFQVSRDLSRNPLEVAVGLRQVSQLGIKDLVAQDVLLRSSSKLNIITGGEISEEAASEMVYRLIRSTAKQGADVDALVRQNAEQYASDISIASQISAGRPEDVMTFLKTFEIPAGSALNMQPEQVVAMAAALADLNPTAKASSGSSAVRLLTKEFPQHRATLARYMGMTPEQLETQRQQNPADLLADFAERTAKVESGNMQPTASMRAMGIKPGMSIADQLRKMSLGSNVRDPQFLAALGRSHQKYTDILKAESIEAEKVRNGQADQLAINVQTNLVLGTTIMKWHALVASFQRAAIVGGSFLAKVLTPIMEVTTDFLNFLSEHPAVAAITTFGLLALVLAKLITMFRTARLGAADFMSIIASAGARGHPATRSVAYAFTRMGEEAAVTGSGAMGPTAAALLGRRALTEAVTITAAQKALDLGIRSKGSLNVGTRSGPLPDLVPLPSFRISTQTALDVTRSQKNLMRPAMTDLANLALVGQALYGTADHQRAIKGMGGGRGMGFTRDLRTMAGNAHEMTGMGRNINTLRRASMTAEEYAATKPRYLDDAVILASMLPFGKIASRLRGLGAGRIAAQDEVGAAVVRKMARREMLGVEIGAFTKKYGAQGGERLGLALGERAGGRLAAGLAGNVVGRGALAAVGLGTGPIGWAVLAVQVLAPWITKLGNSIYALGQSIPGPIGYIVKWGGILVKLLGVIGHGLNKLWDIVIGSVVKGFKAVWDFLINIPIIGPAIKKAGDFLGELPDKVNGAIDDADKALTDGEAQTTEELKREKDKQRGIITGNVPLGDGTPGTRISGNGTFVQHNAFNINASSEKDFIHYKVKSIANLSALGTSKIANRQATRV